MGNWALNNTKLVNFIIAVLIIGGLLSYYDMSKLEDPAIKVRQAMVVTTYPGASAHQVELEVTDKLEKAIREIPAVDNIQSQSMNDLSLITVELQTTTKDIEQEWDMLRRKVSNVQSTLPAGANPSQVRDDFGDVYGMFYALTGDGMDDKSLSDYAELIKRKLMDIDGVSRVEIYGKRSQCINIELSQDKMANLGVMPIEVIQTLNGQNKTVYSGYYDNGTNRVRVTVNDKFNNAEDIGNMLIQGHHDEQLRISDIAEVLTDYETPVRNSLSYDGEHAIGISIACLPDHDITKVGAKVQKELGKIESHMPVGVECHKVFFQPERVSNALNTFLINLLESVLIVIIVLIFTMGWKSGVVIGISLVVIVFGSFLTLGAFDGTLQRVSLGAFILAMGMLVDNAIVIVDGVLIDKEKGKPQLQALTDIGKKTAMPLLGATLIAIFAFLPIFLSPDTAGVYVRDLFIVIAVSLLLSWILALTHVPIMCRRWFDWKEDTVATNADGEVSVTDTDDSEDSGEGLYTSKAYVILDRILNFGLSHRIAVIIGAFVLLGASIFSYRYIDKAFFPDMEYDQLYMEYKLPEGTNSTQVENDLREISEYLRTRPEITHITASVGGTPSRYNLVRSIATPSLSYGELIIDFTSPSSLVKNINEIQEELTRRYPQAYVKLKRYNLMFKKYPIEAMFLGSDPAVLHALTDSAMNIVRSSKKMYLPTTDWEPRFPSLTIDYNQAAARNSGLSRSDVGTSVLAYAGGIPIGTFYNGIDAQNIYVKCVDSQGKNIDNLQNVEVFGMIPNINGITSKETLSKLLSGAINKDDIIEKLTGTTPLRQIANNINVEYEDPVVMRYNGQRAQRLQCSPCPGVGTEEARQELEEALKKIELPEGYTLQWQGEKKASDDSMRYLFANFPMAVIMMIIILIMLFRDYKKPAIIFCCIPLILIGVFPTVLISGKPFGFVAIVGVLGLIGMMIKNGIVLMDEITLQVNSGLSQREALIISSKSRLRPVMMASLTTILGMLPLIPDALFGALAVTIMGGLFVGTLITLIFIPVLYSFFFRRKKNI